MSSLFQAAYKLWATPLERMTYHDAGCCNLPVEIWQEMFTLACASEVEPALLEYELVNPVSANILSTCQGPNILSEFRDLQKPALFELRRSIVLVCKAWYYMGISMLHAHTRIDIQWTAEKMERLDQSLKDNRTFASSVTRLSIMGGKDWTQDPSRIAWPHQKNKAFKRILSRLRNLRVITVPHQLARGKYRCIRPDITLIYDELSMKSPPVYIPLMYGTHWWYNCTTLLLKFPWEPYFLRGRGPSIAPLFPNLISLILNVRETTLIKWITSQWILPVLKNLSITSQELSMWTGFIKKFDRSLEHLEILVEDCLCYRSYTYPPFTMHRLRYLCLFLPFLVNSTDPVQSWIDNIKAPVLHQLSFQVDYFVFGDANPDYLRDKMNSVIRTYRTVKILGVCYHFGARCHPSSPGTGLLRGEDIENWCKCGITVEVTKLGGRDTEVYSKKTLEEGRHWSN